METYVCNPNNCIDCELDECASSKKCGTIKGVKVQIIRDNEKGVYKASDINKNRRFTKQERE